MINLLRLDLDDLIQLLDILFFFIKIVPMLNWLEMVLATTDQIMPTAILMVVIA